jgi:phosphatidylinositol glycan class W
MSSAYNVMVIALLLAVDRFASMAATSRLLFAVNRNQLAFFILANLLTGGVNLSIHTIYVSPFVSWVVISSYTLILLAMFVMLDRAFDVTLKFW